MSHDRVRPSNFRRCCFELLFDGFIKDAQPEFFYAFSRDTQVLFYGVETIESEKKSQEQEDQNKTEEAGNVLDTKETVIGDASNEHSNDTTT